MTASSTPAPPPARDKSVRWLRAMGNFGLAGFVAGFLGLGVLTFRGMMRLLTITSGQAGRFTENDNVAGEFTPDGTLFLVGAGTFLGVFLAVWVGAIRPAYSKRPWLAILVFAPLLTRLLVLEPENEDFAKFGPGWVAVAGFTLGVVIYLALVGLLTHLLETRWRIPQALGLPLGVGTTVLFVFVVVSMGLGGGSPIGLAFAPVAIALVAGLWGQQSWHVPLARAVAVIAGAFGLFAWVQAAIEIA